MGIEVRAEWDEDGNVHTVLETPARRVLMNPAVTRQLAAMLLNAADDLDPPE
jgi:hypothetical protein